MFSLMLYLTVMACFEAPILISKPNVDAPVAILYHITTKLKSYMLILTNDLPGFLMAHQQMGQRTPHTLPGCVPTLAWN